MNISFFILLFGVLSLKCSAQFGIKGHLGASYIEHLSTGLTLSMGRHHSVSFLYGSNFFINTSDFSNAFLQYDFTVPGWKVEKLMPRFGIKGGNSLYTNEYYRWKVISLIPFFGVNRLLAERWDLLVEAGAAYSFEQSVERISQGDIGHYRQWLPEIKAAITYTIFTKSRR